MSKPILSIPNPCSADWSTMTPVEKGKFCNSCSMTVIDFTKMTDLEIIKYLEQNKNTCGRASKEQVIGRRFYVIPLKKKKRSWPSIAAMLVVGMFSITPVFSQIQNNNIPSSDSASIINLTGFEQKINSEKVTITGKVVDEASKEELIGVTLVIDKTTRSVRTDFEGNFQITFTKEEVERGSSLTVSCMGYDSLSIPISRDGSLCLDIHLKSKPTWFGVVGKIDKINIDTIDLLPVYTESPINQYMLEYQKNEYFQDHRYSSY